jgi:hypothetical protein
MNWGASANGGFHLQFADDTLLIGVKSWANVRALKAVLLLFELANFIPILLPFFFFDNILYTYLILKKMHRTNFMPFFLPYFVHFFFEGNICKLI